jgi:hypothetical protein
MKRSAAAPWEDSPVSAEASASPATAGRVPRWRRILAMALIVVSCVLVPLSIVAIWANNQVLDTDDYVSTVSPLARDQDIIDALANRVTTTLFERVDIEGLAKDELPPRIAFLAGPLTTALEDFVHDATLRFLESDTFQTIWDDANRVAHDQVKKALTGGGQVISTREGHVVLDLSPLVVRVRSELSARGIGIFDDLPIGQLAMRFELFDAKGLEQAQAGVRLLNRLAIVLPLLVIALAALGIWLAADRRKALMRWGIGVVIATLALGFALSAGRDLYLNALPEGVSTSAAAAAFDIVLRFMRDSNRVLFVVGLLVGIGAYLAGSGRLAVGIRRRAVGTLEGVGDRVAADHVPLGGVPAFVARYAVALRLLGLVLAFVILIALDHPSALSVLVLLILLLVYLAVVTILERVGTDRSAGGSIPANAAQ